jgi:hypothetical protein
VTNNFECGLSRPGHPPPGIAIPVCADADDMLIAPSASDDVHGAVAIKDIAVDELGAPVA